MNEEQDRELELTLRAFRELLCTVHQDRGEYIERYGLKAAAEEARRKVIRLQICVNG